MRRCAPYLIAFVLPWGFWGGLAVAGVGIYAAVYWRDFLRLSRAPMYAALPFGAFTVFAAALGVDPRSSLPHAIGLALVVTIGLQGARLLVANSDPRTLMAAFVLGVDVLAVSVAADFLLGVNRLPSGLFRHPGLHNWAGTLFALALPMALHLIPQVRTYRVIGVISSGAVVVGTVLALSWVGIVGVSAAATAYGLFRRRVSMWLLVGAGVLLVGAYPVWRTAFDRSLYDVRFRGQSLGVLEHVLRERIAIFREGAKLAMLRPWLGWGIAGHATSMGQLSVITEAHSSLRGGLDSSVNLLQASEAFDKLPWRGWHAWVEGDVSLAPDGTATADLLVGGGVPGHRIHQRVPIVDAVEEAYTFSVWTRTSTQTQTIGLAIRDGQGRTVGLSQLDSRLAAQAQGLNAVRFTVGADWQRLAVTAVFDPPPEEAILVSMYLDGYYDGHLLDAGIYAWGAQINKGTEVLPYERTEPYDVVLDLRALSHFHNWFVQTIFESGVLGLASLGFFLAFLLWTAARHRGAGVPGGAAVCGFIGTQCFDLAVHQSSILVSLLLAMAIVYGGGQHKVGGAGPPDTENPGQEHVVFGDQRGLDTEVGGLLCQEHGARSES